jgi:hypothetical protein
MKYDVGEDTIAHNIENIDKSIRVKSIFVIRDYQTFRCKGFATVEFDSQEDGRLLL